MTIINWFKQLFLNNIVLYHGYFIKYLWLSKILLVLKELKSTEKKN